jgi:hypothetical protein
MSEKNGWPRRQALTWIAAVPVGIAALGLAASPAMAKTPQKAVKYQATPKGRKNCGNCRHFQKPAACKLVNGEISPDGWCSIWSKAKEK